MRSEPHDQREGWQVVTSKTMEKNTLQVSFNSRNQLIVDMPVTQMNALFKKHTGRAHRSPQEVESFINNLIMTKLAESGFLKRKH